MIYLAYQNQNLQLFPVILASFGDVLIIAVEYNPYYYWGTFYLIHYITPHVTCKLYSEIIKIWHKLFRLKIVCFYNDSNVSVIVLCLLFSGTNWRTNNNRRCFYGTLRILLQLSVAITVSDDCKASDFNLRPAFYRSYGNR